MTADRPVADTAAVDMSKGSIEINGVRMPWNASTEDFSTPPTVTSDTGDEVVEMAAICVLLSGVLTQDGIAKWLVSYHKAGPFRDRMPIAACRTNEGRAEVFAVAESYLERGFA